MSHTIFVFGPSCSGKSTLAKALSKELNWTYIDRDELIDSHQCTDEDANALIDQKIAQLKKHIVIDVQLPWRSKVKGEFFCLVYPPLEVLLARDAIRTQNLYRTPERAARARHYVEHTYKTLRFYSKDDFDVCFDSSTLTLLQEIEVVKTLFI